MIFRRRSTAHEDAGPEVQEQADAAKPATPGEPAGSRARGPWDAGEVEYDENDPAKLDLGGLVITGRPGVDVRIQVDEASQQVVAVLLVGPEGALELRAFAAPRHQDLWADVRRSLAAEASRRGGTVDEAEGEFGPELRVNMPVTTPEGKSATQPSRLVGVAGPRWLLRATFFGKPALQPDPDGDLEAALRDVIVVRGTTAMPPGEAIPLTMPGSGGRPTSGGGSTETDVP